MIINNINLLDFLAHIGYSQYIDIHKTERERIDVIYTGSLKDMWERVNVYYLRKFTIEKVEAGLVDNKIAISIEVGEK